MLWVWLLVAVLALGAAPLAHKMALAQGASLLLVAFSSALVTAAAVVGWLLLSTLPMIGLADVIAKRSLNDQEPEVVAAGRAVGGALILVPALPWIVHEAGDALTQTWPWLALSGLCMAAFTVALYQVFNRTFATVAAGMIALAPLLTLMGEIALLGLSLVWLQWIGFALVLLAVIGLSRRA